MTTAFILSPLRFDRWRVVNGIAVTSPIVFFVVELAIDEAD